MRGSRYFIFCRQPEIKFRPEAVSHESADCIVYSPDNPRSRSGSGLLGSGEGREATRATGLARPSNVIECKTESSQGAHSAPYPRALVEFFLKAFSEAGDLVFDPFMGSGTTMAAAHALDRTGRGTEISPGYCDVILRRMWALTGTEPTLAASAESFTAVAASRGIDPNQALNPKSQDSRAIKHRDGGLRPHYGSK
jgi:DNA methylase